jgi:hypothetical protein
LVSRLFHPDAFRFSMMEFKRLLKVMKKKHAELQALAQSPKNHGQAKIKKTQIGGRNWITCRGAKNSAPSLESLRPC